MGGVCGTYGGNEWCIQGLGAEDPTEEGSLQDRGVDGRTILKLIFKKKRGGSWVDLAEDKDRLRALVNVVLGYIKCQEFLN